MIACNRGQDNRHEEGRIADTSERHTARGGKECTDSLRDELGKPVSTSGIESGSSAHVRHSAGTSTRLLMYYFYHANIEAHRCWVFRKPVSVGTCYAGITVLQECVHTLAAAKIEILRGSLREILWRSCSDVENGVRWRRLVSLPCELSHPNSFAQYGELTEVLNKLQVLKAKSNPRRR